jgi:hypothetical protein
MISKTSVSPVGEARYDNVMGEEKVPEQSPPQQKKWGRGLLMIPIIAGAVIAGVAFGLPLIFIRKKEQEPQLNPEVPAPVEDPSNQFHLFKTVHAGTPSDPASADKTPLVPETVGRSDT